MRKIYKIIVSKLSIIIIIIIIFESSESKFFIFHVEK